MWGETNIIFDYPGFPCTANGHVKKSVRIVEQNNRVHRIMSRSDMTHEERLSCFYVDAEFTSIRKREHELTRSMDPHVEPETGLECRRDRRMRRRRIDECVMSIILEQELPQMEGEPVDHIFLARIALGYSCQSAKLAYKRAFENAVEVQRDRTWSSTLVMTERSLSPVTPNEELCIRLQHQQKQQQQQQQHFSLTDQRPIKPTRKNGSNDVNMAAIFAPPPTHSMERLYTPSSLSPLSPTRTSYFAASSLPPPPSSSAELSHTDVSHSPNKAFYFVLPPFPAYEESSTIPFGHSPKHKKSKSWYMSDIPIDEDRWI